MTADEVKLWIRIYAVEILAVNQLAASCLTIAPDDALELVSRLEQKMTETARTHVFPGFDAAMSDFASAELETAIERLGQMASAQIRVTLSSRPQNLHGPA